VPPAPGISAGGPASVSNIAEELVLDDDDLVEDAQPVQKPQKPRRPAKRVRPRPEPEPDLNSLVAEHGGTIPGAGKQRTGSRPGLDLLEEDPLEAALREAKGEDPEENKDRPAGLGVPFPSADQDAVPEEEAEAEAPQAFALPRLPGPHGPRAAVMTGWVLASMMSVVGLVAWRVADHAGGLGRLLPASAAGEAASASNGPEKPLKLPARPATAPPDTGTHADSVPGAGDVEAAEAKLDVGLPAELVCPDGTVAISRTTCIDVGEYPGLRRVPRVNVTLRQAAELCEQRKARLCTMSEWRKACRGPGHARYSYGSAFEQDRCNTASIAGFPTEVALSGAYERCVSSYGAYDLVGNVGEWVAEGMAVGGDSATPGRVATCSAKGRPPPGYAGPDLGFRCCIDLAG
jgi:hypothetical protein